jgi:hypothetical protein
MCWLTFFDVFEGANGWGTNFQPPAQDKRNASCKAKAGHGATGFNDRAGVQRPAGAESAIV